MGTDTLVSNYVKEEKVIMRDFKDLKIAVAGTGARDIILFHTPLYL